MTNCVKCARAWFCPRHVRRARCGWSGDWRGESWLHGGTPKQYGISQKMLLSLAVLLCSVTCGVWRLPRACHTLPESASWLSIYKYYAIRNMCAVHTSVWDTIAP